MPATRVTAPRAFALMLLVVYAILCWRELGSGLEFDESYNLEVVRNLAEGRGYASNGSVQGTGLLLFDPFVSTGPALLVPAAAAWGLTGSLAVTRLVPLAYFCLYLAASWILGRRLAGHVGGLAALASPLLLVVGVRDLTTLSLVPGRFVGELPACALLMAAAVLLAHRRTTVAVLGGLCAGLAIQTKLSFVTAAAVIGLVWLIAEYVAARRLRLGRWLLVGMAAALPTTAFELYRRHVLGDGYAANIEALRAFVSSQAQSPPFRASGARLKTFPELLSGPGIWLLVGACLLAAVVELRRRRARVAPHARDAQERVEVALAAAVFGAGCVLGLLWLFRSIQPSLRQGLPTALLCLPVLAAVVTSVLLRAGGRDSTARVACVVVGVGLVGVVVYSGVRIAVGSDSHDMLEQQRAAARVIEESGTPSLPMAGWWTIPEFQVLTDVPPSTTPGASPPTVQVMTAVRALLERGSPDARAYSDQCAETLYSSWSVLVCRTG
ncbi:hypothetical protein ISU10_09115 [Nocardioides agariphilus]|uniref:Glycosyltransferase RgtA/B/C/D-like domain-containing protein n=1 Tax=Nocardioides agariphilus TaxID=433664 RepID=A0A930YMB2_9ACTN|nr:hypothetical protein [Nocardioides agariphilus]MBF4767924.1 hypothetical protein [Nocardioides agariphilus]